jgi:hypothetical protein
MLLGYLEAHRLGKSRKLVVLNMALSYARRKMASVGGVSALPRAAEATKPADVPPRAA